MSTIKGYINQLIEAVSDLPEDKIQNVVETLKSAFSSGKQVFVLGNGGSAATAIHIACDLQKGLKECTGQKCKATAITDNIAIVTAWANDNDYDDIFAEQLDSLLQPDDVVLAISGSGNSANVIRAVKKANQMGAVTIGWSGFNGGMLAQVAQMAIVIDSSNMQNIEDVHLVLGHLIYTCLKEQCIEMRMLKPSI